MLSPNGGRAGELRRRRCVHPFPYALHLEDSADHSAGAPGTGQLLRGSGGWPRPGPGPDRPNGGRARQRRKSVLARAKIEGEQALQPGGWHVRRHAMMARLRRPGPRAEPSSSTATPAWDALRTACRAAIHRPDFFRSTPEALERRRARASGSMPRSRSSALSVGQRLAAKDRRAPWAAMRYPPAARRARRPEDRKIEPVDGCSTSCPEGVPRPASRGRWDGSAARSGRRSRASCRALRTWPPPVGDLLASIFAPRRTLLSPWRSSPAVRRSGPGTWTRPAAAWPREAGPFRRASGVVARNPRGAALGEKDEQRVFGEALPLASLGQHTQPRAAPT